TSFQPKEEWVPLLDKDLSQWEIYQGFPPEWITVPGLKKDDKGNYTEPIGLNKNINRVFTVTEENGKPVLRVSGEIYGCVGSKKEYENYHLKLQVKWGSKKWAPRLDLEKDSGILYHSIGEYGVDYWKAWALSQEF